MKKRQQVFDTYWKFAAERQEIFFKRLQGEQPPYTKDPILQTHKFCNSYRASDRVSQFLIKDVIYDFAGDEKSLAMRILLFRFFNKIETWIALEKKLGEQISLKNFSPSRYAALLEEIKEEQGTIYGAAFILASTRIYGLAKKHENHLAFMEDVFVNTQKHKRLLRANSLKQLYETLIELPMIGKFMAYQMAIDLNYSDIFQFSENNFTIAGPGAERGIAKCFEDTEGKSREYIIQYMVEHQDEEFKRLGIQFKSLGGRSLQAIDCQGLFCETDKYSRVKFPELKSNRIRIKEEFKLEKKKPLPYFYPPKWQINNFFSSLTAA